MATEILVNLNKKSDFYNKFNNHKINEKLSDYIYNESLEGSCKDKIIINIDSKVKISDDEKQDMIDIIRKKGAGLGSYTHHCAYRVQTENKQKDV